METIGVDAVDPWLQGPCCVLVSCIQNAAATVDRDDLAGDPAGIGRQQKSRERHWALLEDAPKVTYREDFLALIKQFEALAPWIREAAEPYKS